MGAWLTPEEIGELTAGSDNKPCKRRKTQCERLAKMGIPFTTSFGGAPLVERAAVLKYKDRAARKPAEPDWDAMAA